ncbi:hypothetical protein [Iningainema tapete]|uniref:Uncharacterized protein n=1 Tax=Iningainema tapete BLCC-T55 TaxID=2748662 RepID=A0A8J6XUB0_9CYAN|nr:hypothetical protein [Iningainema tapete]MBD2778450.1 hypothetical protein [Iningainema tapete BLCC-T55]
MEDSKEMSTLYSHTFVEHKDYRIFYEQKPEDNDRWLITILRYGSPKPGAPTLGTYWFEDQEQGIQWAKDVIDARLKFFEKTNK